ncbi:E3 ubiquitin-protein ligase XIAP [Mytilus galloprovincialis]|uniref:E3 ubiquitin-protein ligase XIAP n=1 Tax=Mytilus galloprovincialis TaxID=29158 RepID=A0A8B6H124_MYTGA|nr:E3 ubiquitin-protein ligase XIAP [Mytilus galloprovincialis]
MDFRMKGNLFDKEYENDSQSHNNYFSNQSDVKVDCALSTEISNTTVLDYFIKNQQYFHTRTKNHAKRIRKCSKEDKCIRNQSKINSIIETKTVGEKETSSNSKNEPETYYRNNTEFANDTDRYGSSFSKVPPLRNDGIYTRRTIKMSSPFERQRSLTKWIYGEVNQILQAGFKYTGKLDLLYCETCETRTSYLEWMGEKTPSEAHYNMSPHCELAKSQTQFNVNNVLYNRDYLYPKYENSYERVSSFGKWQYGDIQSYTRLVNAGFFYKGWSDYTVCFCCGLWVAEWEKDEDPWKVHAKYCPVCLFLKKSKGLKYIRDIQTEWRKIYKPLKPSMEDEANRIKTFQLSDEYNWSKKAEPLAKAGFFLECIAGEKLKVVCHYCNCQLEPWIHDCDPWLEHVKRMTECKFVEIRKGKTFISRILASRDRP